METIVDKHGVEYDIKQKILTLIPQHYYKIFFLST